MNRAIWALSLALLLAIILVQPVYADEADRPIPNFNEVLKDESGPDKDALAGLIKDLRHKAVRGDADAQEQLGEHYEYGDGVKENVDKAAEWYQRAANQGNAKAQNKLGFFYLRGLSVTQSYTEAYFWISISSSPLDKESQAIREEIKKSLPPEKLAEQQRRIVDWAPQEEEIDPLDVSDDDDDTDEQDEADEKMCKGYDIAGRTAPLPKHSPRTCRLAYGEMHSSCFKITSCTECEAALKKLIVSCRKNTTAKTIDPAFACEVDSDCFLIETNYCEVTYEPLSVNRAHLQEVRRARAIPVTDCQRSPQLRAQYRAVCVDHLCQIKKSD